jgi:hypothetical protein
MLETVQRGACHDQTTTKKTPLANLYLTMLQTAGVPVKGFADSTEPLSLT